MLPPITADEAALLRAVCLDPWDDLPRLIIADWYEEHGQPERAMLVRAQCAHAGDPSDEAAGRADVAHRLLVQAAGGGPGVRALGPLVNLVGGTHRGWPVAAAFHAWADFDAAADAGLWARAPVVRASYPPASPRPDPRGGRWAWQRLPGGGRTYVAPRVYRRLAGLTSPALILRTVDRTWYASEAAGQEALSRAMVDEGRAAAGLPPLAWPAFPDPPT